MRDIVPESDFDLVDRNFQIGDVCKKDVQAVESGVIVATQIQAKVQHAITHHPVSPPSSLNEKDKDKNKDGWLMSDELEPANDVFIGDFVVLDDWIGQVCFVDCDKYLFCFLTLLRSKKYDSKHTFFTVSFFTNTLHLLFALDIRRSHRPTQLRQSRARSTARWPFTNRG